MRLTAIVSLAAVSLFLWAVPAADAWSQTYGSWQDPDAPSDTPADTAAGDGAAERLHGLIERLRAIVAQAERDKAANPLLLRDLSALADAYDRPSSVLSVNDAFADGDFQNNPVWTVTEGGYFIEQNWGLRNVLEQASSSNAGSGDNSGGEVAAQIFGQILNQALGGQTARPAGTQPTSIFTEAPIANAFAAEVEVSSWVGEGRFVFGPYQGNERTDGYRVAYSVGGAIELLAVSSRGARTIDRAAGPFTLEDKQVHTIGFTRDADGSTRVSLDGRTVIDVVDRSFRDDFQGWGFATRGGDFIVKRVTVRSRF